MSQIVGLLNPLANQLLQAEYGCGISGSASFWHPGWEAACRTANKQTGLAASPVFAINQLVVMLAGALGQPGAADMLVETGMLTDLLLANAALHSLTVGEFLPVTPATPF